MYFLTHWTKGKEIVVDLYYAKTKNAAKGIEKKLLYNYIEKHYEFPPLNLGIR